MTQQFKDFGTYYGYPSCCTDSLLNDIDTGYFLIRPERKLSGSGYIPCKECDEKYTPEQLVENINKKRNKALKAFEVYKKSDRKNLLC